MMVHGFSFRDNYFLNRYYDGVEGSCHDVVMDDDELITNWGLVVEAFAAVSKRVTHLDNSELPAPFFEVLLRLVRTPCHRLTMSQLAHEITFSTGGFTKLADRMESAGLVSRVACPEDRRVTWMTLTPLGEAAIAEALPRHVASLRATVLGALGEDGLREVGSHMRVLRDAMNGPRRDA
jgi:DNA-binding MarR family transcriptional regulator